MLRLIHKDHKKTKEKHEYTITGQRNSVKQNETNYLFTSILKKRIDD